MITNPRVKTIELPEMLNWQCKVKEFRYRYDQHGQEVNELYLEVVQTSGAPGMGVPDTMRVYVNDRPYNAWGLSIAVQRNDHDMWTTVLGLTFQLTPDRPKLHPVVMRRRGLA